MDVLIMVTTFLLTVIVDPEVGLVSSNSHDHEENEWHVNGPIWRRLLYGSDEVLFDEELPKVPPGVILYEIHGALFFGAAQKFQDLIREIHSNLKVIISRMRHVPFIDASATKRINEIIRHFESQKIDVILSGPKESVRNELERSGIYDVLDRRNLLNNVTQSLKRANKIVKE